MDFDVDDFIPPEWACVEGGDPFLAKVVAFDDYIGDCENNVEWAGWSEAKAQAEMTRIAWQQQSYELALLFRWYELPSER